MDIMNTQNINNAYGKKTYGWPGVIALTIYDSELEANIEKLINDDYPDNHGNDKRSDNLASKLKRTLVYNSHGVPKNMQNLSCKFKVRIHELNLRKTSVKTGAEREESHKRIKYLNSECGKLFESLKKEVSAYYKSVTNSYNPNDALISARDMEIIDYYQTINDYFQRSSWDYQKGEVVTVKKQ